MSEWDDFYSAAWRAKLTPKITGWQPIETAPKGCEVLLVSTSDPHDIQCCSWDEHANAWLSGYRYSTYYPNPTHWMPLPEPPV